MARHRTPAGRIDRATRQKITKLYRLHAPIRRLHEFLAMLRRDHEMSMTTTELRDILHEAGVRERYTKVPAELKRKIAEMYGAPATKRTNLKAFWRLLRDEHGFTHTLTCLRLMLIRLGLYVPRPMTEGERRRWARYRAAKAAAVTPRVAA